MHLLDTNSAKHTGGVGQALTEGSPVQQISTQISTNGRFDQPSMESPRRGSRPQSIYIFREAFARLKEAGAACGRSARTPT